jgi:hypothetical protein
MMNRRDRGYKSLVMGIWLILSSIPVGVQAGGSGLSFLKLGVTARGVAMGDAGVAVASGSEATYYNPAGLFIRDGNSSGEITVMHKEWIQDTRTNFLGGVAELDEDQAIGVSINSTTVSDIEVRTRPGPPEGTFASRNYSLGFSYARVISENIRAGITGKFLYEKILIDEASGWGIDAGVQCATPIEHLSVGAAVSNLGSMGKLRSESTTLPSLLRVGGSYGFPLESLKSDVMVASDYLLLFNGTSSFASIGGEFTFDRTIAARLGYALGSEGRKFSTGLGIRYGLFNLDYAYAPLAEELGNTHTISVGVRF